MTTRPDLRVVYESHNKRVRRCAHVLRWITRKGRYAVANTTSYTIDSQVFCENCNDLDIGEDEADSVSATRLPR